MVNKAAVFEAMLRSGGWLATLPEAVRQAVFKASSVRTIAPGAALFEQDGPPTGLHGVFSGDIRVVGHSRDGRAVIMGVIHPGEWVGRSEEQTSELQSLMRTSYAVFRSKKKKY